MATASATAECAIARIEKEAMIRKLRDEPTFSQLFMAYLLSRNIQIEADLVDQLFNSSEKRLARILLMLSQFGKDGKMEPVIQKERNLPTSEKERGRDRSNQHNLSKLAEHEHRKTHPTVFQKITYYLRFTLWQVKGRPFVLCNGCYHKKNECRKLIYNAPCGNESPEHLSLFYNHFLQTAGPINHQNSHKGEPECNLV